MRLLNTKIVVFVIVTLCFWVMPICAQDSGDRISLELNGEKLEDAMRILSDATGFNILVSNKVAGTITAYVVEMEPERALEETIEVNGYHYVRNDDVVWVLTDEEYFEDFDLGRERRVIRLERAHVRDLVTVVTELLGPNGQVLSYPTTNVLIVAAEPERLASLESIIRELDTAETTRVFQLQYASAPILLSLLQSHVAAPERMYADIRTNQISVSGTPEQLDSFEDLLQEFDRPDLVMTKTIRLRYAKADAVAELLREVLTGRKTAPAGQPGQSQSSSSDSTPLGGSTVATALGQPTASSFALRAQSTPLRPRERSTAPPSTRDAAPATPEQRPATPLIQTGETEGETSALGPLANVTADTRTNSIIITHTESVVKRLEAIVHEVDVPNEFHIYQFLNVNPADIDIEGKLAALFDEEDPYLNVDPLTRTVTFRCGPERAEEIYELLRTWDQTVRQVRLDAEILSVNVSVVKELGVSWQAIFNNGDDVLGVFFPPAIGADDPQGVLNIGSDDDDFTATVQALATDNDTQRIASPRILVRDAQQALFSTARDEPFTVVTVDGNTQTTLEDVRFLNVGVNLSVTPTINQDDLVTMDVLLEISSLVEIRDDIPVVDRSTAQSSISVPSGSTAILGGLRQSSRSKLSSGVPVLRKIPILGGLFRNKRNDDSEFEILLILRPLIIDFPSDEPPLLEDISNELTDIIKEDAQDYKLFLQQR